MPAQEIRLPHHWTPRPYQQPLWDFLSNGGRRAAENWHRRSGKDDICLHHMACAAHERVGNYWYLLPEYAQCRKAMWDAVNPKTGLRRMDEAFPVPLRKPQGGTNDQEMKLTFKCGSTVQLLGADNFHSLVGSPPIGLVFSEYSRTNPSAWAYLMPIVEENGGWAIFNSTPYGANHFKTLCAYAAKTPGWHYQKLTATDTGVYTDTQLALILAELQAIHGDDYGYALYLQEYFCEFDAAIPGSIYGEALRKLEMAGAITDFEAVPGGLVYTAWDLGRTDSTAIWFYQWNGRDLLLLDYHESSLKDVDFYVEVLQRQRDAFGWTYANHWLPHDARPRTLAAGGQSILQQFGEAALLDKKLGAFRIVPRLDVQEGIQAARKTFPRCRFHKTRCEKGLEALKHYHRVWDEELKMFLDHPAHDWSSHGADAFRYLALSWKIEREKLPDVAETTLKPHTLGTTFGQLKAQHLQRKRSQRELTMT